MCLARKTILQYTYYKTTTKQASGEKEKKKIKEKPIERR